MEIKPNDLKRFWNKVKKTNNCWEWTRSLNNKGYGIFNFQGRTWKAHRFSYEISKGLIPNDMTIDHLCRNRICVNPEHLEAVTMKENCLRGISFSAVNARKTHCPKGHEYNKENTYHPPNGGRICMICKKNNDRIYLKSHWQQHLKSCKKYREKKKRELIG